MELAITPQVFKNDKITIAQLRGMRFESTVVLPGPSNPSNAGISLDVIKSFYKTKKILEICLEHQCITQFFGAFCMQVRHSVHGKVSSIFFDINCPLFKNIPQGFVATKYHSLTVKRNIIPENLTEIVRTETNMICV